MIKKNVIVGILWVLFFININGCIENNIKTIKIKDSDICYIIDEEDSLITLDIKGSNCSVKVSEQTELLMIIISGSYCTVNVSKHHSFTSNITGKNSFITYYDK